jgi:hypothetical protein
MTASPVPGHTSHCAASPGCDREPSFRVELRDRPGRTYPEHARDACAEHLGKVASAVCAAVAALARELEGGYLQVCALDTSRMSATDGTRDGIVLLPFCCIPLDP